MELNAKRRTNYGISNGNQHRRSTEQNPEGYLKPDYENTFGKHYLGALLINRT